VNKFIELCFWATCAKYVQLSSSADALLKRAVRRIKQRQKRNTEAGRAAPNIRIQLLTLKPNKNNLRMIKNPHSSYSE